MKCRSPQAKSTAALRIRPCTHLIAEAITECIDQAFRFVFILSPQNGKQNFARWSKQREACRASQNLERRKDGENRRETNRGESNRAQKRHEHQRDPNPKPFH